MAIGTAAAIGLGVAGVGSVLSSRSASKAAQTASDTSLQVAQQNNQLARENRDMLMTRADPFLNSGQQANALLNDFLGFNAGQDAQQAQPAPQPNALEQFRGGPNPADYYGVGDGSVFTGDYGQYSTPGANDISPQVGGAMGVPGAFQMPGRYSGYAGGTFNSDGTQATQSDLPQANLPGVGGPSSKDAFAQFIDNSDYAFQFGEGANALNSGYAGAGTLQSGAAMKGLEGFRQDLQQGYRNDWANMVGGQQSTGLNALGAAAGVGINSVNQMSANNNAAGTAAANAALIKGNNNPLGNAFGAIGGGILGLKS